MYCQIIHRYAEAHPPTATHGLKIWSTRIMPQVLQLIRWRDQKFWAIRTGVLWSSRKPKSTHHFSSCVFQLCELGTFYGKEQPYSLSLKVISLGKYLRKLAKQEPHPCGQPHSGKTAQPSLLVTWPWGLVYGLEPWRSFRPQRGSKHEFLYFYLGVSTCLHDSVPVLPYFALFL